MRSLAVAKNNDRPLDAAIGARIRTLRLHHKLSQGKLAEKVGVTFQQIQKYEQGSNQISPTRLLRFANVLDVSAGLLLGENQPKNTRTDPPQILSANLDKESIR